MRLSTIYLLLFVSTAYAQNPAVTVNVDAALDRKPINPKIYGIAFGTTAQLLDLNAPLNRYGGNSTTRYNWQQNADNRGQDWYFESIADSSAVAGERGDTFIATTRAGGAEPLITVPMIDWVAKVGANRTKLAGFSQAKYGAQTGNDWQWFADAGNGILKSTNQNVTGNDPNDANVPNSATLQDGWVQHMVSRWGLSTTGGLQYYILDNEPSIWHSTHRDVHPVGAKMTEMRDKMLAYAAAVKGRDAAAQIVGPEEWGWSAYTLSGYDQQYGSLHGWSNLPDRTANANWDYLPWLLNQLKGSAVANGQKPLDVFSVHYYPQGGEFGNDTSTTMQLRRNRSTRSLWDPNYVDETWIADKVQLIPRLRGWVNSYYWPGTPIAITEYNWGAEGHANGATTQADIYGIFGREGLDMAARWTTPDASTPTYKAMKLYRNYDGNKSGFGDTSVRAAVPNPDNVSAFAAVRTADQALTVMVINKYLSGSTPVTVNLSNFNGSGSGQVWQLTAANTIARLADAAYSGTALSLTAPAQSITLLVLPAGGAPVNRPPVASFTAAPASGTAPVAVSFDASASSDPDGTIASYAWTFGDGGTGTGKTTVHTYSAAGSFTATLQVTDNAGASASTSKTIVVTAPAVPAVPGNLTGSGGSGFALLTWTDSSSNEAGFYVERAPNGTNSWTRIGSVTANTATYRDAVAAGRYKYRVQAFNAAGVSAYSNTVTIRVR
ncbi:MAG: glycoside hydrolase family 44 protein [Bryobacteraceae bacterium]